MYNEDTDEAKEAMQQEIIWKAESYALTQKELITLLAEIISDMPGYSGLPKQI